MYSKKKRLVASCLFIYPLWLHFISCAHDRTTNENTATWQRLAWRTGWVTRKQRSGNTVSYLTSMQISPRASVRSREGDNRWMRNSFSFSSFSFFFLWEVPRSQRGVKRTVFGKQWRAAMCDLYRQMGRAVRDDSREGEWSGPETERVEELCFVSLRPVFMSPSRSVSLRRYIVFSVCLYFNYYSLGLLGVNIGNRPQTLLPPSEERL